MWPTCCADWTGSVFPEMSALWSNQALWHPACMPPRGAADPHCATWPASGLAAPAVHHSWAWHVERVPLATCNENDAVIAKGKRKSDRERDKRVRERGRVS